MILLGRVTRHPQRPERLAFIRTDGRVENTFAVDATLDSLKPVFAAQGFVLSDDGTVTKEGTKKMFDQPYWTVGVSFPVDHLSAKAALYARVETLAARRGGRPEMYSEPTESMRGKPGYETFGLAVAFEAGDANTRGFIDWVARDMASVGVQVSFDPDDVTYPSDEDC